ncbi:hypothetical protein [Hymenobacter sp. UYP22]|uniref:hypothetical protein n=1 Tax=Hymenobacter sp. UYP22 TaxID=3156348 RepID=UPI00339AB9E9
MTQRLLSSPDATVYCQLTYDPTSQWLRTVWRGFVGPDQAQQGGIVSLEMLNEFHCPYLLNDNSQLDGPWFDSVHWLTHEWGPAAARAGLRYVAHVTQAHKFATSFTATPVHMLFSAFEIQLFDNAPEAIEWLSSCQQHQA